MKKLIACLAIAILLFASSCEDKSYTCDCTALGGTNGGYSIQNTSLGKMSSASAQAQCSSWENEQQANLSNAGGTATVNCQAQD